MYLIISLSMGVISPLVCWYLVPEFNPTTKPLSYFGIAESTAWYWNLSVIIIAFAIYLNAKRSLPYYFNKKIHLRVLHILLFISFISLCLTGIVAMDVLLFHRISACVFFLTYILFIFSFGFFRSQKYVRKGMFSMIIALSMLLSSLLLLPFPSYGVFEITYFAFLLYWNGKVFYKRIQAENRSVDKKLTQEKTTQSVIS